MQDRWYQGEAVEKTFTFIEEKPDKHPIIVMPTGSGKSHTMCLLVDKILSDNPTKNILVLSHVKEILEQDHAALERFFNIDIGLYSAGLESKTIKKITVAGIQSAVNSPELFERFDLILIDECHLIPVSGEGQYRTFLQYFEGAVTYIGLTATHFRLGHGYIHEGEGALFTDISYNLGEMESFNRLVAEGWLSKMVTKPAKNEFDTDGLKITAGEYNLKAMSERFDRISITNEAVDEIIKAGKKLKLWLIFAIDIDHAEHITKVLEDRGIKTACIHSKMDGDRDRILKDVKAGGYRAVVNVDILTTGFDAPQIDLIGVLRPTKSPVLHVQMIGRGLRVVYAEGYDLNTIDGRLAAIEAGPKPACLVLDFAGNTETLGPINDVRVVTKKKGDEGGEAITKTCPECGAINHPVVKFCDNCNFEFIFQEKISSASSNSDIVRDSKNIKQWLDVTSVKYSIHQKKGVPSSLRVTYQTGLVSFSEWIAFDSIHASTRARARHWVKWRWLGFKDKLPENVAFLYANADILRKPKSILVNNSGKFPSIEDAKF